MRLEHPLHTRLRGFDFLQPCGYVALGDLLQFRVKTFVAAVLFFQFSRLRLSIEHFPWPRLWPWWSRHHGIDHQIFESWFYNQSQRNSVHGLFDHLLHSLPFMLFRPSMAATIETSPWFWRARIDERPGVNPNLLKEWRFRIGTVVPARQCRVLRIVAVSGTKEVAV